MNHSPHTSREWHRYILNLSWPIILSGISVPLVGLIDTAVVGQLAEPHYMAAVAVGAVIFSNIFWVFGFLRMSTTGFISQANGASDNEKVSIIFLRALMLALLLGLLVIVLQSPLAMLGFSLMGAEEAVTQQAQVYFDIRIWSAPASFINYALLGCFIGLKLMRFALFSQLLLNILNVVLDVIFVMFLDMKADGVALASLISEYLAVIFGLWLLRHYWWPMLCRLMSDRLLQQRLVARSALRVMMTVNADLFFRTLMLTGAFFIFTMQGAELGTTTLAANAILINMVQLIAHILDGFAHTAEALVGTAYGAKNREKFIKSVRYSTFWAFCAALCISLFYLLFGHTFIDIMTVIPEVREVAYSGLIWIILSPLISVWSYQMDGVYIGITETRLMLLTVAVSFVVYIVVLYSMPEGNNHVLWFALMLFFLLRGLTLALFYPKIVRRLPYKA